MGKKNNNIQHKILIPIVTTGCALMCFSVGFASWIVAGGTIENVFGIVNADDFEPDIVYLDCFDNLSMTIFDMSSYGILQTSDGSYSKTGNGTISGYFTFNPGVERLTSVITSLNEDISSSSAKLLLSLGGTDGVSNMTIDSSSVSFSGSTIPGTNSFSSTYILENIDLNIVYEISFSYSIRFVSTSNFDSFYSSYSAAGSSLILTISLEDNA